MTPHTCTQGGKVLRQIETPKGVLKIKELCLGAVSCGNCPGLWPDAVDFAERILVKPEERYFRYFNGGTVRYHEEQNKHSYWTILGAFTETGLLVGVCYIGASRVRFDTRSKPKLENTAAIELAFVVDPSFRRMRISQSLFQVAYDFCRKKEAGTNIEIIALRENHAMVLAMKRMGGNLTYEEDCATLHMTHRKGTVFDALVDTMCVFVGTVNYLATTPLRMSAERCKVFCNA